jgi:hypothetical protein
LRIIALITGPVNPLEPPALKRYRLAVYCPGAGKGEGRPRGDSAAPRPILGFSEETACRQKDRIAPREGTLT